MDVMNWILPASIAAMIVAIMVVSRRRRARQLAELAEEFTRRGWRRAGDNDHQWRVTGQGRVSWSLGLTVRRKKRSRSIPARLRWQSTAVGAPGNGLVAVTVQLPQGLRGQEKLFLMWLSGIFSDDMASEVDSLQTVPLGDTTFDDNWMVCATNPSLVGWIDSTIRQQLDRFYEEFKARPSIRLRGSEVWIEIIHVNGLGKPAMLDAVVRLGEAVAERWAYAASR